jgi:hypothetical protein
MSLTMQIIVSLAFFLILGTFCAYMLYRSEKEAKRLLNLRKSWYPNRTIADKTKELTRIRFGVVILYAGILMLSLWMFQRGLMVLMELWNRGLVAE